MDRNTFTLNGEVYRESYLDNIYTTKDGQKVARIKFEDGKLKEYYLFKPQASQYGHLRVEIKKKKYLVHRLVYDCWGEQPLDLTLVIDHIDANPRNNDISNLRQVSQQENILSAVEHGNFGHNHNTKLSVFDTETNTTTIYDSVKDFLRAINAPDYMIRQGGLVSLKKRKEYKRYMCTKLDKR